MFAFETNEQEMANDASIFNRCRFGRCGFMLPEIQLTQTHTEDQ